jgi:hypothetical protein
MLTAGGIVSVPVASTIAVFGNRCRSRPTSHSPSRLPGIWMSTSTTSGSPAVTRSSAVVASGASVVGSRRARSCRTRICRMRTSSSTTSTECTPTSVVEPDAHRFIDRNPYIGLSAADDCVRVCLTRERPCTELEIPLTKSRDAHQDLVSSFRPDEWLWGLIRDRQILADRRLSAAQHNGAAR